MSASRDLVTVAVPTSNLLARRSEVEVGKENLWDALVVKSIKTKNI